MIPASYEQWRECIEVRCKIQLTAAFINERLKELQDGGNSRTQTFAKLYGAEHLQNTITWFRQAQEELAQA